MKLNDYSRNAIIMLVAKIGIDAAIRVMEGIGHATTHEEALAALRSAATKTADDYVAEAKAEAAKAARPAA